MVTTQIIYNGSEYEMASDCSRAELPEWPVQDSGAHWHHEQFDGQVAVFRAGEVHFGFMAEEVPEEDLPRHADGAVNTNDLFGCNNGKIYRSVA